jgi:hypothetical protein
VPFTAITALADPCAGGALDEATMGTVVTLGADAEVVEADGISVVTGVGVVCGEGHANGAVATTRESQRSLRACMKRG